MTASGKTAKRRVVVALCGNALLRRAEPMTIETQRGNVRKATEALAPLAMEQERVISYGNGPQVELPALQAAAYQDVSTIDRALSRAVPARSSSRRHRH